MKNLCFFLGFSLIFTGVFQASIINVPGDQPTIQEGINAAQTSDTVLVADGTYYENINFHGKAITVASHFLMDADTNHINNTIVNGSQPSNPDSGSVVFFVSGEDTNSILCGFTITEGTGTVDNSDERAGGGIYCYSSGPRILFNKIQGNTVNHFALAFGGGIALFPRWGYCENDVFIEGVFNTVGAGDESYGGGIFISYSGFIQENIITYNSCTSENWTSFGGGILSESHPAYGFGVEIRDNTIAHNSCISTAVEGGYGGGIRIAYSGIRIENNEISFNEISGGTYCAGAGIDLIEFGGDTTFVENNIISFNTKTGGSCYGGGDLPPKK
jgi:hypothetical protein